MGSLTGTNLESRGLAGTEIQRVLGVWVRQRQDSWGHPEWQVGQEQGRVEVREAERGRNRGRSRSGRSWGDRPSCEVRGGSGATGAAGVSQGRLWTESLGEGRTRGCLGRLEGGDEQEGTVPGESGEIGSKSWLKNCGFLSTEDRDLMGTCRNSA